MAGGKLGLTKVADPALLKALWKRPVRRRLRAIRFVDFVLGHDPLEWAWTEYEINELAGQISAQVAAGTFRPSLVEVIRGAKSVGLTRPLSLLAVP